MARTNVSIWDIRGTVFMTDYNSSALVNVAHLVACFCEKPFSNFWSERDVFRILSLHKKWSFRLRISAVNVTKFAVSESSAPLLF